MFIKSPTHTIVAVPIANINSPTICEAFHTFLIRVREFINDAKQYQINLELGNRVESDCGTQLKSKEFLDKWRDKNFIHYWFSPPHSQAFNDTIKRAFGTIWGSSTAMLLQSRPPKSLWAEAFMHTAHIYDLLPHRGLKYKFPFEARTETKPDVSHLHLWSKCLVLDRRF